MSDKYAIGLSNDNLCECGDIEDANHFLLECGRNLVSKVKMIDNITNILSRNNLDEDLLTIDLLLYGSNVLSLEDNKLVFSSVQTFIAESKRFE